MQALLLNGSPRGAASNTLRLSRAFLQGTGWPFETFSLTENRIEPCRGCMACWRSGAPCTIADDFSAFVGQFRRADVLIASFPLYYFGLPAQLKALLDRTISLMEPYHGQTPEGGHCSFQTLRDPALRRKKLVVISSCGYTEAAPMYEALLAQLDRLCSGRNYTPLFFPQGELLPVEKLDGPRARRLQAFEAAGREYAETGTLSEQTLAGVQRPQNDNLVKLAKITNTAASFLIFLAGLMLIFLPSTEVTSLQRTVLAVLFLLTGAAKMIGYYSNDLYRLAFQFDFAIGILCALLAGLLAFLPQRVLPTLPVLLSVYVILDALLKLQIAMDARRFGMESWIAILCSSLLLGLGGLFALSALYSSFLTPSVAIGIALGLDGLQNAWITMHTVRVRARKKNLSEKFGLENHEEDPD